MHARGPGFRKRDIFIGLAVAAVTTFVVWDTFVEPLWHRDRNRGEIRALYEALTPGMTRDDVSRSLDGSRYPHLTVRRRGDERWFAETPSEFGAGNWILVIEFADERVRAIRVRTADTIRDRPVGAPPDRVPSTAR